MKKIFTLLFFIILGLNKMNSATFVSKASGGWNAGLTTWTITSGTDTDKIPDLDDDVSILAGHTVSLTVLQNDFKTLNIAATATLNVNAKALNAHGNITNNGKIIGTFYYLRIFSPCTLTSASTFTNSGVWYVYSNLTIAAGTTINKALSITLNPGTVNNLGSVTLSSGALVYSGASSWTNGINSFLSTTSPYSGIVTLNASAVGNTVVCSTGCTNVPSATYYNLTLTATNTATKTATGNITVLNDFTTTGANNTFNLNNKTLTVGGNWTNSANKTITNQGTVTFNGSGTQTITRTSTEVFNNLTLSGSGTVLLGRSITINGTTTLSSGTLDPSASSFTANIVGNAVFNGGSVAQRGVLNFNGVSAQTISGSSTANLYNVRAANAAGVSVTSNAVISNTLSVVSGMFGTSGAGVITIPATGATTYGKIASVGATGSLTGTGWDLKS